MSESGEIVIERPREAVWRRASDPANWERWEEDLSEGLAAGPLSP